MAFGVSVERRGLESGFVWSVWWVPEAWSLRSMRPFVGTHGLSGCPCTPTAWRVASLHAIHAPPRGIQKPSFGLFVAPLL